MLVSGTAGNTPQHHYREQHTKWTCALTAVVTCMPSLLDTLYCRRALKHLLRRTNRLRRQTWFWMMKRTCHLLPCSTLCAWRRLTSHHKQPSPGTSGRQCLNLTLSSHMAVLIRYSLHASCSFCMHSMHFARLCLCASIFLLAVEFISV